MFGSLFVSMNGPVPFGFAARGSWSAVGVAEPVGTLAAETIGRYESSFRSGASGVFVFNRTVASSTISTVSGTKRAARDNLRAGLSGRELDRRLHIGRGERLPLVEGDALPQLELGRQVVDLSTSSQPTPAQTPKSHRR